MSVLIANELALNAAGDGATISQLSTRLSLLRGTAVFYFPPSRLRNDYDKTRWQEFKELDFIGLGLFTIGLTVFFVGLTYLGKSSFSVGLVAATVTIGGMLFIACFLYDFTTTKNPIFPYHLFAMFGEFTVYLIILSSPA